MPLFLLLFAFLLPFSAFADDETADPALVPPVPLHEQVLHLQGDPDQPVDLVVTLYTPEGPGPSPLAVMNHGANGSKEKPAAMQRYRFTYAAYYFLSRGYAVALPMMRGFGDSGGHQERYQCELAALAMANGLDIQAVIGQLTKNPLIDGARVVVAGQSFERLSPVGRRMHHLDPVADIRRRCVLAHVQVLCASSRGRRPRAALARGRPRRSCCLAPYRDDG